MTQVLTKLKVSEVMVSDTKNELESVQRQLEEAMEDGRRKQNEISGLREREETLSK